MNNEIDIEDLKFELVNENGEKINCEILYEAVDEVNKKIYIAYTDYVKDEEGKFRIILAEVINDGEKYIPVAIEDEELIESLKEGFLQAMNKQE